jgi:hypothetical protein
LRHRFDFEPMLQAPAKWLILWHLSMFLSF